jgi:hypothetical protein
MKNWFLDVVLCWPFSVCVSLDVRDFSYDFCSCVSFSTEWNSPAAQLRALSLLCCSQPGLGSVRLCSCVEPVPRACFDSVETSLPTSFSCLVWIWPFLLASLLAPVKLVKESNCSPCRFWSPPLVLLGWMILLLRVLKLIFSLLVASCRVQCRRFSRPHLLERQDSVHEPSSPAGPVSRSCSCAWMNSVFLLLIRA